MSDNPYAPPTASLEATASTTADAAGSVPPSVVRLLAQTRPWVVLLSILFVAAFAVIGLAALAPMVMFGGSGGPEGRPIMKLMPLMIVMVTYVAPVIYLWRYGRNIRRLQRDASFGALEQALASQKSFWKFVGIAAVIFVALSVLSVAYALVGRFRS